jgi:hypothetical protein
VPFSWGKVSQEFSHRNRKGSSIIILDWKIEFLV